MSLRLRSIGSKLFWAIGVPGLIVAIAGVWLFWREADTAVTDTSRTEALSVGELVASSFSLGTRQGEEAAHLAHQPVTELVRSDWRLFQHLRTLRVVDGNGVVRWSRNVEEEGKPVDGDVAPAPASGEPARISVVWGQVEAVRSLGGAECAGCHEGNSGHVGTLQVVVAQPELHDRVASVFGRALTSVLILFGVLLLLTAVSLHVFLNWPLSRLASVMRRAEEGDFLVRAEVKSSDELGSLAESFNRMLARITSMKADEIDKDRDLQLAQEELSLKQTLEATNKKLEQRVLEQSLLFEVSRSLTSTLELHELFARIGTQVAERLGIPQFSIMLARNEKLVVKSAWPRGSGKEGLTFDMGEGACGRAARTQTAVYIPDLRSDSQVYLRRPDESVHGSLLVVPMVHKGSLLGVINLERPAIDAFSREEIELLGAVADLAAIATKNALLHEETVELSITDPLTGAANRRQLFARLELEVARALRYESPLSVLMIDIDHFKLLNDLQGHRTGDIVLRKVCDLLKEATRKVDTLARYGGEEFMIVLPQVGKKEALEAAEKLRRAVEDAAFEEGAQQPTGRITISIGVGSLHEDAKTLEQLVDCSDAALYASKRGGRNRATAFEPGMELHPGRERGPAAAKRRKTGEIPAA